MSIGAIKKQIRFLENTEKQIFWAAFSVAVLLLVSYGILFNRTIMNAMATENMNSQISSLSSAVNSLEFKYLNLKNSISMDLALSRGFVAVKDNNFVQISPSESLSLSINAK